MNEVILIPLITAVAGFVRRNCEKVTGIVDLAQLGCEELAGRDMIVVNRTRKRLPTWITDFWSLRFSHGLVQLTFELSGGAQRRPLQRVVSRSSF